MCRARTAVIKGTPLGSEGRAFNDFGRTAERRRERVAGSEKKVSQEGGSRGRVDQGARFAGLAMVTNLTNLIS